MDEPKLLLVYNADSGFFNTVVSSIHKVVSPETYACQLCQVTYGIAGMVDGWRSYLDSLPIAVTALHRNEFREQYAAMAGEALPAIFLVGGGRRVDVLLGAEAINGADTINALIGRVDETIRSVGLFG